MIKGGFNFLEPSVIGEWPEFIKEEWAKNDFPIEDLQDLTNGLNVQKIISFNITPVMKNPDDDFATLFFKYSVYDITRQKELDWDLDTHVKLFYKKVKIHFDRDTSFDFINSDFNERGTNGKDYRLIFSIFKERGFCQEFDLLNKDKFFNEIKKSAEKSNILDNAEINLTAEFVQVDSAGMQESMWMYNAPFTRTKESPLLKVKYLSDKKTGQHIDLPSPVYTAKLDLPFRLYNIDKQMMYESYSTTKNIFQSTYNLVIVPITLHDDSLIADLFLDYAKLNIDNIPRWTPIKKRISLKRTFNSGITMPKENWTANFTRDGNRYDIYGYSDFENYIKEYLIILFQSIHVKAGDIK
jgi:hypothetical protein